MPTARWLLTYLLEVDPSVVPKTLISRCCCLRELSVSVQPSPALNYDFLPPTRSSSCVRLVLVVTSFALLFSAARWLSFTWSRLLPVVCADSSC